MRIRNLGWIVAVAVAGLLVSANVSNAQQGEGKKQRSSPQQRVEQMDKELKLTAEQKTKLTALFEEQTKKMQGMRDLAPEERRAKGREMREEYDKKMKVILTTEQWDKWQKSREEMMNKAKKKGKKEA